MIHANNPILYSIIEPDEALLVGSSGRGTRELQQGMITTVTTISTNNQENSKNKAHSPSSSKHSVQKKSNLKHNCISNDPITEQHRMQHQAFTGTTTPPLAPKAKPTNASDPVASASASTAAAKNDEIEVIVISDSSSNDSYDEPDASDRANGRKIQILSLCSSDDDVDSPGMENIKRELDDVHSMKNKRKHETFDIDDDGDGPYTKRRKMEQTLEFPSIALRWTMAIEGPQPGSIAKNQKSIKQPPGALVHFCSTKGEARATIELHTMLCPIESCAMKCRDFTGLVQHLNASHVYYDVHAVFAKRKREVFIRCKQGIVF